MISRKLTLAIFLLASLIGCAAPLKKQAFNSESATSIKTVALAHNINQDQYGATVLAHPGMSFGLIGGLVAAADMQNKSNKLTAALNVQETRAQERFGLLLQEKLNAAGYQTNIVVLNKDTKDEQVFDQIVTRRESKDAILSVLLTASYIAAGPGSDYFPHVLARVKKVGGLRGDVLYEDTFTYGYTLPTQTVHMASAEKYRFANIDVLIADPEKARQGLFEGLEAISAQIAADLKK
jgi:hypothetical protein